MSAPHPALATPLGCPKGSTASSGPGFRWSW